MKIQIISLLIILISSFFLAANTYGPGRQAKKYKIDLDLPPQQRWEPFINDFKQEMHDFQVFFIKQIKVPAFVFKLIGYPAQYYHDKQFVEELQAISKISGMPFGELFVINFMYELFAYCTSIVFRNSEGRIVHGRNLDYEMAQQISKLSADGEFYKGGKLIFKAAIMAGFVGTHTGERVNGFGISLNERDKGSIYENLYEVLLRNTHTLPYYIRKVLEEEDNYESAMNRFKSQELIAPAYLILSGISGNQGAVITRDRQGLKSVEELNDEKWFLVQTNYDRDVDPTSPDHDHRRVPAENKMMATGQANMTEQILFDNILNSPPNKRVGGSTLLTEIMSPANGYTNSTLWY